MKTSSDRSLVNVHLASAATLMAWLLASFVPGWRAWGVSFLSPLSPAERIIVVVCVMALYLLILRTVAGRWEGSAAREAGNSSIWPVWVAGASAAALFILLHGRTHFLGDSALRLSTLSSERLRGGSEFSLAVPLLQAAQGLWGEGVQAGLRAYQWVSIAAGALCVMVATFFARRIFDSWARAWVFTVGLLSAGSMLLFFGYVENHALLVLAVFAFTVSGIALCRRRGGTGWVVATFALAVSFQALGWCLLPAMLYLVLEHSPAAPYWRKLPFWLRAGAVLAAVSAALVFAQRLYAASSALRLGVLPLFKNRLTVDDYTLLSLAHVLDLLNLVCLLLPGLVVALVFLKVHQGEHRRHDPAITFLWWSMGAAWLVAIVLEAPLGMPRSWDRLAFAGVPLAAWVYYRLLSLESPRALVTALLCASLSGCALLSRAWVQARPEASVKLAMSYFSLDPGRSRTGVLTVGKYLLDHNTTATYGVLEDFRRQNYPEEGLRERLNFLFRDHKQLEAADVCQRIIKHDPRFASAWMFLGFIYNNAERFDSATTYLIVADGLDPHNTGILNELGRAYYFSGQTESAVRLWQESLKEDSLQYVPHLALATWNRSQGNTQEASKHLSLAASQPGAPGDTFLELARDLAEKRRTSEARAAYEEAVTREADTAKAALLLRDHPELGPPVTGKAGAM